MENQTTIFGDLNLERLNKLSKVTRLGSMLLDHAIMCFVFFIFSIPLFYQSFRDPSSQFANRGLFNFPNLLSLLGMAIYISKDCVGGQSIAKRIFGLQIIEPKNGEDATPIRCVIRNIFCFIWPIEVIVTLFNPSKRLGDRIAGTKVVLADRSKIKPSINYIQIIVSIVLSYLVVLLIFIPFENMF